MKGKSISYFFYVISSIGVLISIYHSYPQINHAWIVWILGAIELCIIYFCMLKIKKKGLFFIISSCFIFFVSLLFLGMIKHWNLEMMIAEGKRTPFLYAILIYPIFIGMTYGMLIKNNIYIVVLSTLPLLELEYYTGNPPTFWNLCLIASAYLITILLENNEWIKSSKNQKENQRYSALIVLGIGISLLLCISICFLMIPKKSYEKFLENIPARSWVREQAEKIPFLKEQEEIKEGALEGGMTGGNLEKANAFTFSGKTALQVTVNQARDAIYLKGFVGAVYKDNHWSALDDSDASKQEMELENISNEILSMDEKNETSIFRGEKNKISIQEENANQIYTYLPYHPILNEQEQEQIIKKKEYEFSYWELINYDNTILLQSGDDVKNTLLSYGASFQKLESIETQEEQLREDIYKEYTEFPKEELESLIEVCNTLKKDGMTTADYVKAITGKLQTLASYTLTPGSCPEGKEFVTYFLFENKQGYSTHFATAATLMFRSVGIPARYVEGYLITPKDLKEGKKEEGYEITVKDTNAHAWVEVYLDGFGWIPVEVTPGYSDYGIDSSKQGNLQEIEFEGKKENVTPTPEKENRNTETVATKIPEETKNPISDWTKINTKIKKNLICYSAIIAVIPVLFLIGIFLRKKIIFQKRKKSFQIGTQKERLKKIYFYFLQIEKEAGREKEGMISYLQYAQELEKNNDYFRKEHTVEKFQIFLKVFYDEEPLQQEQAEQLMAFVEKTRLWEYNQRNWYQKLWWKYIKVYC